MKQRRDILYNVISDLMEPYVSVIITKSEASQTAQNEKWRKVARKSPLFLFSTGFCLPELCGLETCRCVLGLTFSNKKLGGNMRLRTNIV